MSSSRQEVLRRVREAIGMPSGDVVSLAPVARGYRTTGDHPAGSLELIDLLVGRLEDYKATVVRCTGDDEAIGAAIGDALRGAGAESAVVPAGLAPAWSCEAPGVVVDTSELTAGQLDQT